MKLLIAITCCKVRQNYADAQRVTWIKDVQGADYRFFFGEGQDRPPKPDEVFLPCGDGYRQLPAKVYHAYRWALDHDYDYIFKTDDDVYIRPERLLASGFERYQYSGRVYTDYACGLGYWLSRRAMQVVVDAGEPAEGLEDQHVGTLMKQAGIRCVHDPRFNFVLRGGSAMCELHPEFDNNVILAGEFPGHRMQEAHAIWAASIADYQDMFDQVRI